MTRYPVESLLLRAVIAGLVAGLLAGLFHLAVSEPVIQQAIDLERAMGHAAGADEVEEVVSRPVQRAGLVVGYLGLGLIWGILFGVAGWLLGRFIPVRHPVRWSIGLATAAYWTVGLFPMLKYPASPPGIGDPETIAYRQGLYLGLLGLAVLAALLTLVVYRDLGRLGGRWAEPRTRLLLSSLLYLVCTGLLAFFLPANPDPVNLPPALVTEFRGLAVAGVTIFWLVLGGSFLLLTRPRDEGGLGSPVG